MKADPPRRADGRCACGCGKRLARPRNAVLVRRIVAELRGRDPYARDPFASRECCERFYGIDRQGQPLDFEAELETP